MGREIRKVPKDWKHPQMVSPYYSSMGQMVDRPMRQESWETDMDEYVNDYVLWRKGEHPYQLDGSAKECTSFIEWNGEAPTSECYNKFYDHKDESVCTHFQLYETVSEGTPQSPVFETLDQLEKWLVQQGHSEKSAKGFCKNGWAPSVAMNTNTGTLKSGIDTYDI